MIEMRRNTAPPVTLSPSPNRYLSQHLQNDHQREKPDHNDKNQAFNTKQHNNIGVILKKNSKRHFCHFQIMLGASAIVLGAPSNTHVSIRERPNKWEVHWKLWSNKIEFDYKGDMVFQ